MLFELIKPNKEVIDRYNEFWTNPDIPENDERWNIEIFADGTTVDIRNYDGTKGKGIYEEYGKKDYEIKKLFENDIEQFLRKINSVYHTRVSGINKLYVDKEYFGSKDINRFISYCRSITGKNEYSFASKVYSFIKPEEFPIIDSLSATLLWNYLDDQKKKKCPISEWGNYNKYKEAYDAFIDQYELKGFNYKQIDVFLWTYATVISNYWKSEGVLNFNGISYKANR